MAKSNVVPLPKDRPWLFKPGRAKTGGRKKGTPNMRIEWAGNIARQYGPEAIAVLVEAMRHGEERDQRVYAATELLNRGYGRAPQAHLVGIQPLGGSGEALDFTRLDDGKLELLVAEIERALTGESGEGPALIEGHASPAEEAGGGDPPDGGTAGGDQAPV